SWMWSSRSSNVAEVMIGLIPSGQPACSFVTVTEIVAVAPSASMLQSLQLWSSEHSITDCPIILHVPVYLQCNKCSNEQRAKIQFGSKEDLQNNNMSVAVSVCKCCRSSIEADSTTLYWKDN